jgi:hypothetical protein
MMIQVLLTWLLYIPKNVHAICPLPNRYRKIKIIKNKKMPDLTIVFEQNSHVMASRQPVGASIKSPAP